MRRIGSLLGLAAVLALPLGGSASKRPLPLRGPEPATVPLTAILAGATRAQRLAHLDPGTLATLRTSAPLGPVEAWAASPGGTLLALGIDTTGTQRAATLRFADAGTLRLARRGVALDGALRAALWPVAGRLVAVVDDGSGGGLAVETVDTVGKRVVARHAVPGIAAAVARTPGALVLLVERPNSIGPATLEVVGADGVPRGVRLDRIAAGSLWPADQHDPIGTIRAPALAADPAGTAYVLDPDGLVAAVDVGGLAVAYHTLSSRSLLARLGAWLVPAAEAKGMNGPYRTAVWLGDGLLALTGGDYAASPGKGGKFSFSESPAGLAVVDTRDWTSRVIDQESSSAAVADGALLATGGRWSGDGTSSTSSSEGLVVYGPDGLRRGLLFPGQSVWLAGSVGGLALVEVDGKAKLVDAAAGHVVRELGVPYAPQLLVGAGS